jgi:ethanolamine ammonia-lyase small subunit
VLADGLSASAIEHHAAHMVEAILDSPSGSRLGAVVLAHNARVALADEIGALFQARFVVIAIGERPGLSSPDSLGLYLTYQPKVGRRDSERNCLSNIHAAGLSYHVAARKLDALITGAARIGASGTKLKDETDATGHLLDAPRPVDTSAIK